MNSPPNGGKTVIIETAIDMIGERNNAPITMIQLSKEPYMEAELRNKLGVISDEIGGDWIYDDSKLMKAVNGQSIETRQIYGHPFQIVPYGKWLTACNEPPYVEDKSGRFMKRLSFIDCPHVFVPDPDPVRGEMQSKGEGYFKPLFLVEMPGIKNWALEGLRRLEANKWVFTYGKSKEEMYALYRRRANPVICFIEEILYITDDEKDLIGKEEIWQLFEKWREEKRVKIAISRDRFFKGMKAQGIESYQQKSTGKRFYVGIQIGNKVTASLTSFSLKSNDSVVVEWGEHWGKREGHKPVTLLLESLSPALNGDKGASGVVAGSSNPEVPVSPPIINCVFPMQEPFLGECGICHEKTILTHYIMDRLEPDKETITVCSKCAALKENQEKEEPE